MEDQYEGQRINAFDALKVQTESEDFKDDKFNEDKKAFDAQGEVEGTNSFLFSLDTSYLNSSGSVLTFSTSQTSNLVNGAFCIPLRYS